MNRGPQGILFLRSFKTINPSGTRGRLCAQGQDPSLHHPPIRETLPSMTRLALLFLCSIGTNPSLGEQIPLSGKAVPGLESADKAFADFMTRHDLPRGSVAIMKNGALVYARGFGWAEVKAKKVVQPPATSFASPLSSMVDQDHRISSPQKALRSSMSAHPLLRPPVRN
jgi:hypothetical protein